ncbi:MAG: GNAT family N-acetyltransferase [Heyndrickxia sp.]
MSNKGGRGINTITIRFFQNIDTPKIVQLLNENAQYNQTANKTTIEEFREFLDEPGEEIKENTFVAIDGDELIAYQSLCFVKSDEHINVYSYGTVHYQHRKKGIGSLLLEKTLKHLAQRAVKENKKIIYNHMVRLNRKGQNELAEKFELQKYTDLLSYEWINSSKSPIKPLLPNGYSFISPCQENAVDWANIDNEAFSWRKNHDEINQENVLYEFNSLEFSTDYYILCLNEYSEPIGFVCGREEGPHHAVISTLAVRPLFQGRGIGKALLNEVMNRMITNNIQKIRLSVDANNPTSAIRLYKKSCFTLENRIIHYIYEMDPLKEVL